MIARPVSSDSELPSENRSRRSITAPLRTQNTANTTVISGDSTTTSPSAPNTGFPPDPAIPSTHPRSSVVASSQ